MANSQKRSGNPARQARISAVEDWRQKNKPAPLELPSGNTALVRYPGLPALLAEGLFPASLTAIAQDAIDKAKGKKKAADKLTKDMSENMSKLGEMLDVFDRVLVRCVVEPKTRYHKEQNESGEWIVTPDDERDDDVLYTDWVDIEDKIFIFNCVCGGSRDLERFREEFGDGLDAMEEFSSDGSSS